MRTNSHTTNNNIKPNPLTLVSSLYQVVEGPCLNYWKIKHITSYYIRTWNHKEHLLGHVRVDLEHCP